MDFTRLFDIPRHQQEHHPLEEALAVRGDEGWEACSTDEMIRQADRVSAGLLRQGVEPGERIGIISESRPEWNFLDLGMQQVGAVNVPLFPKMQPETWAQVLQEAGVERVFLSGSDFYEKLQGVRGDIPALEHIHAFDAIEAAPHWEEILPDELAHEERLEVEARMDRVKPSDVATIIYTSGTTGRPKGVMLTHRNIVSNVRSCADLMPVDPGDRALSFLPLNHVFERMIVYLYMASGVSIHYAESTDTIGRDLREVRPRVFTTVPRLLEKVYERIVSEAKSRPAPLQWIFFGAAALAERYRVGGRGPLYDALLKLFDPLVFKKWRQALGDETVAIVSGGAALNPRLARIFTAAGIPIMEGYGLTETSPVIAVNRLEEEGRRIGSVGRPVEDVEVRIADDEEILCRGPNVMEGYYERPEKTEEVVEEDGWFHTGDVGRLDEDGFLHVEDREDSVFMTSGGKKVAPQPIENTLKESYLVDHAMVCCAERKMVTAVIAPDLENLEDWCAQKGIAWEGPEATLEKPRVKERYARVVREKNETVDHTQQIKEFTVVPEEWSVESGELTPTMKVKRDVIKQRYGDRISGLYEEEEDEEA